MKNWLSRMILPRDDSRFLVDHSIFSRTSHLTQITRHIMTSTPTQEIVEPELRDYLGQFEDARDEAIRRRGKPVSRQREH